MTLQPEYGESDSPHDPTYEFMWSDVVVVALIIAGVIAWIII